MGDGVSRFAARANGVREESRGMLKATAVAQASVSFYNSGRQVFRSRVSELERHG
jgi:hypothetical protein